MNRTSKCALLICVCMAVAPLSYAQSSDVTPNAGSPSGATSSKQADRDLAKAVRRALGKTQGFDVSGVFVRARSGAVTLSGTVRSGDQIAVAGQVAQSVPGVKSVSNKLGIFHGGNG
jgi:hyperosmotically inducible periplasmic protein